MALMALAAKKKMLLLTAAAVACDSHLFHFNTLDHLLQISVFLFFSFQNGLFQLSDPFQSEQLESCWKGKREERRRRGSPAAAAEV